jgi:hypothetical protein
MTDTVRRRYSTIGRVPDEIADTPALLDAICDHMADGWRERVAAMPGAATTGGLEITTSDNLHYGCEILDDCDSPVLDDDGVPLVDRDKLVVRVSGWVDVPLDLFELPIHARAELGLLDLAVECGAHRVAFPREGEPGA